MQLILRLIFADYEVAFYLQIIWKSIFLLAANFVYTKWFVFLSVSLLVLSFSAARFSKHKTNFQRKISMGFESGYVYWFKGTYLIVQPVWNVCHIHLQERQNVSTNPWSLILLRRLLMTNLAYFYVLIFPSNFLKLLVKPKLILQWHKQITVNT